MSDHVITLPNGHPVLGDGPVVVVGPNGSGKTRESRKISGGASPVEFINALRNTRISVQLPAMSQLQARQNHESQRNQARNQPWELASDFDLILAQLLAEDGDAARAFREEVLAGRSIENTVATPLQTVEEIWREVFVGRTLTWTDWAPIISNEQTGGVTYAANQMSDGERAALYVAAKVLLAPQNVIIVVDEPETHFHSRLAVDLWNSLEKHRKDARFIYVTHDLTFALSRTNATYLLAAPNVGLRVLELGSDLPSDVKHQILGAASFSYYASRVIFCEGDAQSLDFRFFSAWFSGRDTVVTPVGSCESVRECVRALGSGALIDNLDSVGIVDRDFSPDSYFTELGSPITLLPVHEIEGVLCLPTVVERLAQHLAKPVVAVAQVVATAIDENAIVRVAQERWKLLMMKRCEDRICARAPSPMSEKSLRSHAATALSASGADPAETSLDRELALLREIASSGDVRRMLSTFPCKPIAGAIAQRLGSNVEALFELVAQALRAVPGAPLYDLGRDLEEGLGELGLPPRVAPPKTHPEVMG